MSATNHSVKILWSRKQVFDLPSKPQFQLKLSLLPSFPPSPLASLCCKTSSNWIIIIIIIIKLHDDWIIHIYKYLKIVRNEIIQCESVVCYYKINAMTRFALIRLLDEQKSPLTITKIQVPQWANYVGRNWYELQKIQLFMTWTTLTLYRSADPATRVAKLPFIPESPYSM